MSRLSELRDKQREDWNSTAPGWKKWDQFLMKWLNPIGERILDLAELKDGDLVLDVATGSGEPGLSAAKRVGKGKVIGIDISEEMANIARQKAKALGIKNYQARVYSGSEFPFDSNYFDAVICRFGVMFFPDVLEGLKEMVRVLKPGGRVCVSVWGPQNEGMKTVMQGISKGLGLPEPPPDAPNPFSCSESGKINSLMRQAGLHDVEEAVLEVRRTYRSPRQYWEFVLDMNSIIADAFDVAIRKKKEEVKLKVEETLNPMKGQNGQVSFDSVAWIDRGVK